MNVDCQFAQSLYRERLYEVIELPEGVKMALSIAGGIFLLLTTTWLSTHAAYLVEPGVTEKMSTALHSATHGRAATFNALNGRHIAPIGSLCETTADRAPAAPTS
jgi:hypothetical protein